MNRAYFPIFTLISTPPPPPPPWYDAWVDMRVGTLYVTCLHNSEAPSLSVAHTPRGLFINQDPWQPFDREFDGYYKYLALPRIELFSENSTLKRTQGDKVCHSHWCTNACQGSISKTHVHYIMLITSICHPHVLNPAIASSSKLKT